ncbi:MAG: dihydroorotate dehydrogenase [Candidatus Thermoplasmatota archaeon]
MLNLIDISTKISDLELENPTILASGLMDEDAESMKRILRSGAAAVVTKSIGLEPNEGYPNPTAIELEHGILNAMGLPNPGIEKFKDEIKKLSSLDVTVIGSIYGSNAEEFREIAEKMQQSGAKAIELNLSCPHAKKCGLEVGSDPKIVENICTKTKKSVDIPVFAKISPNLNNVVEIAEAAEEGEVDAIVAINTVKAMKINLEFQKPVLYNKIGGYSGGGVKPIGVRCVYEIFKNVDIPVIGCGGVLNGLDALEYFMAGASAVEIGSGIYYRDLEIFKEICKEIKGWMKKNDFQTLTEIIGSAHK